MSERSFLRDLRPFEKKREKKVKKFQSGIFGLFLTAMASRLSGIDSTNVKSHKISYSRLAHLLLTSKDGVVEMADVIPQYGIHQKRKDVFEDMIAIKNAVKKM